MTAAVIGAGLQAVGLVGLGHIGMAVAERLIGASRPVIGYRRGSTKAFEALGGTAAGSVAQLAERCETIIVAVPDAVASNGVLEAILGAGRSARTIIDFTAMSPPAAIGLSQVAERLGSVYLEAPISGTAVMVLAGRGTILVGGSAENFEKNLNLLRLVAPRVLLMGGVGAASAVKSGALMMMAINTLGAAEALAYAESFGVNPDSAIEGWNQGPAASSALAHRGPLMAQRNYAPAMGRMTDFRKLLEGIDGSATTPTRLLRETMAYLSEAIEDGRGDGDLSGVYENLRHPQPER